MKIGIFKPANETDHNFRGIGGYTNKLIEALGQINSVQIQEFSDINKLEDVDLVHYPFFDFFKMSLPLFKKYPSVITIHDVIPLIFPRFYPPGLKGLIAFNYQKMALKNIEAIITDSLGSKKDLIKVLKIPEKKIFPISLAPDERFKKIKDPEILRKIKVRFNLPGTFVLYVGDVNWNKNLISIAKACKKAGVDLVLVGRNFIEKKVINHPELKTYQKFLDEFSKDPMIHFTGFVLTDELVAIMNLAKATILASFYEGFGLTILESQSCGTPVITSAVSSMPEVAGEGAILVDPNNINSLTDAIKAIISDYQKRNLLIRKGLENVKGFSWVKTAEETLEVYKYVLHS